MALDGIEAFAAQAPAFALVLARIGAFMVSAPLFGGPYIPGTVKGLFTLALAIAVWPAASRGLAPITPDVGWIALLAQEVFVGLALGWLLSLLAAGVRMGGELMSRHAGFTAAESFDPEADVGAGPFADMLFIALVMLILATDTHHHLIAGICRSWEAVPLGAAAITAAGSDLALRTVAESCVISLALSFPVLGVVMAITLVEGVLTRAVPQINVLHLSFAVKILVSLLVVIAGLPSAIAFLHTVVVAMQQLIGPGLRALG
ncbi:MAG: hypothetical protein RLZZ127_3319 [Planctomycetota bacterium]|jgi:flagellar biosynthetic protein FliR